MNAELLTLVNMLQTLHGRQVRLRYKDGYLSINITGEYRHQPLDSGNFCHVGNLAWFKPEHIEGVMFESDDPVPVLTLKTSE